MWCEVSCRIAQAFRVFGSLQYSIFTASDLTLEAKRMVYRSVVLESVVLKPGQRWQMVTMEALRETPYYIRRRF